MCWPQISENRYQAGINIQLHDIDDRGVGPLAARLNVCKGAFGTPMSCWHRMSAFRKSVSVCEGQRLGAKVSIVAAHLMSASAALFTKSGRTAFHPSLSFRGQEHLPETGRSNGSGVGHAEHEPPLQAIDARRSDVCAERPISPASRPMTIFGSGSF